MSNDPSQYPDAKELSRRKTERQGVFSDRVRRSATGDLAHGRDGSPTAQPEQKTANAAILRLAKSLGVDPEVLVKRYPADTVRRLRYPTHETKNDDGTTKFEHDLGIVEGVRSLIKL